MYARVVKFMNLYTVKRDTFPNKNYENTFKKIKKSLPEINK